MLPLKSTVADGLEQLVPQHRDTFVGVTGKADGNLDPSTGLAAGYIWWHYENDISEDRALIGARLGGAAYTAGVRILLGYTRAGTLVAIEAVDDEVNAPIQREIAAAVIRSTVLPSALLDVALVHPSGAGGFTLTVEPYPGAFWLATTVDVSALNGAAAGEVALGIVAHDPDDDSVALYGATTIPYAGTTRGISASYFEDIVLPFGLYPLAGIAVAHGTTDITNDTLAAFGASIVDLRLHITSKGVTTADWHRLLADSHGDVLTDSHGNVLLGG